MVALRLRLRAALTLGLLAACTSAPRIHDRPISFSTERRQATLRYIAAHYGRQPADIRITPRVVVLHWTAIDDLEASFAAMDSERLPDSRPELAAAGELNVSTQFLVDRDGAIFRLMPELWMARHVIGLNLSAVGIENVGGSGGVDDLTRAQVAANVRLVRYLVARYPSIEYLIGHLEYREFEGHPLWLEQHEGYRTDKVDPGGRFMWAVRRGVAGLGLKGPAQIRAEKRLPEPRDPP